MWKRIALSLLLLCVAAYAQKPPILHNRQFVQDPSLRAAAGQTVLLDYPVLDESQPTIRYQLQAGKHEFCLNGNEPFFTGMALEDNSGHKIFEQDGNSRCVQIELKAGAYNLHLLHASSVLPDSTRLTYTSVDAPSPRLTDAAGEALGGFWAVQPDPNLDPMHRDGRLRVLPPFVTDSHRQGSNLSFMPLVADFQTTGIDQFSMFRFRYDDLSNATAFYPSAATLNLLLATDSNSQIVVEDNGSCSELQQYCALSKNFLRLHVNDVGHYQFNLQAGLYFLDFAKSSYSPLTLNLETSVNVPAATFRLVFRYFPDGNVGALEEGEVALYEKPNYQGKAIVLGAALANLPEWTTIMNSPGSMRLGNNTAVNLYGSPNFDGFFLQLYQDSPNPPLPSWASLSSIQMQTLTSILPQIRFQDPPDCSNCQLNGADLTGFNLTGLNLQNAHLAGAHLTNTKFNGAVLSGADFTGALLSCTDFSGIDKDHLHDLTTSNFINIQVVPQDGCSPNFSYTRLSAAFLPAPPIRLLNLTGAVIDDLPNHPLSSQSQPVDLSGAMLQGAYLNGAILDYATGMPDATLLGIHLDNASLKFVNLQNAILDGASLQGANLTQAVLNSAHLTQANLSGAKLYGAVLDNANLESAVLQSAYLTNNPPDTQQAASLASAFLRNVNLSSAQMSGADFTNASFYGFSGVNGQSCAINADGKTSDCATASHAVMNNTVFSGAYLFGVDFTNTQATGAVFSNAVLVGANFDQAILGSDSAASTTTSFDSAFLQGANLATATLDHVSLAGAFVDFNPSGNTIDVKLPGSHTKFPGYWAQAGQGVCAEPGYSGPTTVPETNSTISCPDGNKYLYGCGAAGASNQKSPWNNGTDISSASTPASYQNNATYTPASANPICPDDVNWDVGAGSQSVGGQQPSPGKSSHRPHRHRPRL